MYYTYMVRCADNSIYTGMTNNLEKRINEHINKSKNIYVCVFSCGLQGKIANKAKKMIK